MKQRYLALLLGAALSGSIASGPATAETFDFGGTPERFSEGGDRKPPRCQINIPRSAQEPFFIQWNCTDDKAAPDEIRTSLWVLRNGEQAAEKVKDFLGFPASIFVDETVLGSERFQDGLPASFRLVAQDRAGISAISPYFTVVSQDNRLTRCTFEVITEQTEANGGTTGLPSERVLLSSVEVQSSQTSNNDVRISTFTPETAEPCEIRALCRDNNRITFEALLALNERANGGNMATGTITAAPGSFGASVEGTADKTNSNLRSVDVSGMTVIDGVVANTFLSCRQ